MAEKVEPPKELEKRLFFSDWKVRNDAYTELGIAIQKGGPMSGIFQDNLPLIAKFINDANATCSTTAIELAARFARTRGNGKSVAQIVNAIVDKGLSSGRTGTINKSIESLDSFVHYGHGSVVQRYLVRNFSAKIIKVVTDSINTLKAFLEEYGTGESQLNVTEIIPLIPNLMSHKNNGVRKATASLVGVCCWVSGGMDLKKQFYTKLLAPQQREIDEGTAPYAEKEGYIPSKTVVLGDEGEGEGGCEGGRQQCPQDMSKQPSSGALITSTGSAGQQTQLQTQVAAKEKPKTANEKFKMSKEYKEITQELRAAQAKEIPISETIDAKLQDKKWTERRDGIQEIYEAVQGAEKVEYTLSLHKFIKKINKIIWTDINVVVATLAMNLITSIYMKVSIPAAMSQKAEKEGKVLLCSCINRFKESNRNASAATCSAIDSLFLSAICFLDVQGLVETNGYLNKNPKIREGALAILPRLLAAVYTQHASAILTYQDRADYSMACSDISALERYHRLTIHTRNIASLKPADHGAIIALMLKSTDDPSKDARTLAMRAVAALLVLNGPAFRKRHMETVVGLKADKIDEMVEEELANLTAPDGDGEAKKEGAEDTMGKAVSLIPNEPPLQALPNTTQGQKATQGAGTGAVGRTQMFVAVTPTDRTGKEPERKERYTPPASPTTPTATTLPDESPDQSKAILPRALPHIDFSKVPSPERRRAPLTDTSMISDDDQSDSHMASLDTSGEQRIGEGRDVKDRKGKRPSAVAVSRATSQASARMVNKRLLHQNQTGQGETGQAGHTKGREKDFATTILDQIERIEENLADEGGCGTNISNISNISSVSNATSDNAAQESQETQDAQDFQDTTDNRRQTPTDILEETGIQLTSSFPLATKTPRQPKSKAGSRPSVLDDKEKPPNFVDERLERFQSLFAGDGDESQQVSLTALQLSPLFAKLLDLLSLSSSTSATATINTDGLAAIDTIINWLNNNRASPNPFQLLELAELDPNNKKWGAKSKPMGDKGGKSVHYEDEDGLDIQEDQETKDSQGSDNETVSDTYNPAHHVLNNIFRVCLLVLGRTKEVSVIKKLYELAVVALQSPETIKDQVKASLAVAFHQTLADNKIYVDGPFLEGVLRIFGPSIVVKLALDTPRKAHLDFLTTFLKATPDIFSTGWVDILIPCFKLLTVAATTKLSTTSSFSGFLYCLNSLLGKPFGPCFSSCFPDSGDIKALGFDRAPASGGAYADEYPNPLLSSLFTSSSISSKEPIVSDCSGIGAADAFLLSVFPTLRKQPELSEDIKGKLAVAEWKTKEKNIDSLISLFNQTAFSPRGCGLLRCSQKLQALVQHVIDKTTTEKNSNIIPKYLHLCARIIQLLGPRSYAMVNTVFKSATVLAASTKPSIATAASLVMSSCLPYGQPIFLVLPPRAEVDSFSTVSIAIPAYSGETGASSGVKDGGGSTGIQDMVFMGVPLSPVNTLLRLVVLLLKADGGQIRPALIRWLAKSFGEIRHVGLAIPREAAKECMPLVVLSLGYVKDANQDTRLGAENIIRELTKTLGGYLAVRTLLSHELKKAGGVGGGVGKKDSSVLLDSFALLFGHKAGLSRGSSRVATSAPSGSHSVPKKGGEATPAALVVGTGEEAPERSGKPQRLASVLKKRQEIDTPKPSKPTTAGTKEEQRPRAKSKSKTKGTNKLLDNRLKDKTRAEKETETEGMTSGMNEYEGDNSDQEAAVRAKSVASLPSSSRAGRPGVDIIDIPANPTRSTGKTGKTGTPQQRLAVTSKLLQLKNSKEQQRHPATPGHTHKHTQEDALYTSPSLSPTGSLLFLQPEELGRAGKHKRHQGSTRPTHQVPLDTSTGTDNSSDSDENNDSSADEFSIDVAEPTATDGTTPAARSHRVHTPSLSRVPTPGTIAKTPKVKSGTKTSSRDERGEEAQNTIRNIRTPGILKPKPKAKSSANTNAGAKAEQRSRPNTRATSAAASIGDTNQSETNKITRGSTLESDDDDDVLVDLPSHPDTGQDLDSDLGIDTRSALSEPASPTDLQRQRRSIPKRSRRSHGESADTAGETEEKRSKSRRKKERRRRDETVPRKTKAKRAATPDHPENGTRGMEDSGASHTEQIQQLSCSTAVEKERESKGEDKVIPRDSSGEPRKQKSQTKELDIINIGRCVKKLIKTATDMRCWLDRVADKLADGDNHESNGVDVKGTDVATAISTEAFSELASKATTVLTSLNRIDRRYSHKLLPSLSLHIPVYSAVLNILICSTLLMSPINTHLFTQGTMLTCSILRTDIADINEGDIHRTIVLSFILMLDPGLRFGGEVVKTLLDAQVITILEQCDFAILTRLLMSILNTITDRLYSITTDETLVCPISLDNEDEAQADPASYSYFSSVLGKSFPKTLQNIQRLRRIKSTDSSPDLHKTARALGVRDNLPITRYDAVWFDPSGICSMQICITRALFNVVTENIREFLAERDSRLLMTDKRSFTKKDVMTESGVMGSNTSLDELLQMFEVHLKLDAESRKNLIIQYRSHRKGLSEEPSSTRSSTRVSTEGTNATATATDTIDVALNWLSSSLGISSYEIKLSSKCIKKCLTFLTNNLGGSICLFFTQTNNELRERSLMRRLIAARVEEFNLRRVKGLDKLSRKELEPLITPLMIDANDNGELDALVELMNSCMEDSAKDSPQKWLRGPLSARLQELGFSELVINHVVSLLIKKYK